MDNQNCGHCTWCEKQDDDFVCTCEDSEAYGLSTAYDDYCDEFDEREE